MDDDECDEDCFGAMKGYDPEEEREKWRKLEAWCYSLFARLFYAMRKISLPALLLPLMAGCAVDQYRAIPPAGATDTEQRRVHAYCSRYTDPEPCYLAAGYVLERLDTRKTSQMVRVDWRTTF